jgi:tocopherol O-methyltransferase
VTPSISIHELVAYYEGKTQTILQRYGPGPRVHYHTGLVDEPEPLNVAVPILRQRLVAAQERVLFHAAEVWSAHSTLCGEVLDVGCGLGGGAIFWAQEFGAQVTAVTIAPSHIDWVKKFSAQAGVTSQVQPLLSNVLEVPGENCFDAAVAVDSSSSLPRKALFRRLASLLRPGGYAFITDCFLGRPEYEEPFNRHWRAQIGTVSEYIVAAREAGLQEKSIEDISLRTEHFWALTIALMQTEAREKRLNRDQAAKLEESLDVHNKVRQGLVTGGLRYALLSFYKQ